jgi:hypothetical protein
MLSLLVIYRWVYQGPRHSSTFFLLLFYMVERFITNLALTIRISIPNPKRRHPGFGILLVAPSLAFAPLCQGQKSQD